MSTKELVDSKLLENYSHVIHERAIKRILTVISFAFIEFQLEANDYHMHKNDQLNNSVVECCAIPATVLCSSFVQNDVLSSESAFR